MEDPTKVEPGLQPLVQSPDEGTEPGAATGATPRVYSEDEWRTNQGKLDGQVATERQKAERLSQQLQAMQGVMQMYDQQTSEMQRRLEAQEQTGLQQHLETLGPETREYATKATQYEQQLKQVQAQLMQVQMGGQMAFQLMQAYRTAAEHGIPLAEVEAIYQQNASNPGQLQAALTELRYRKQEEARNKELVTLKEQVARLSKGQPVNVNSPLEPVFDAGSGGNGIEADTEFIKAYGEGRSNDHKRWKAIEAKLR